MYCTKKKLIIIALSSLILTSCLEEHDDLIPQLEGVPAGGLTSIDVVRVEEDEVILEIGLFVVDHFGSFIEGLSLENWQIDKGNSNGLTCELIGIENDQDTERGPFSATLLFDQSGSINTTDPQNSRVEAGLAFAEAVKNGDDASIVAFTNGGFFKNPYEILTPFSTNSDELTPAISRLLGTAGGGTPLFRSIKELIPYTAQNGSNKNQAIVAFTDGADTEGGVSIDELIQNACAFGVRLFTVGLGEGVDKSVLSRLAFETGGAVMLAEDALQLIALYNSMGDLLHGQAQLYRLTLSVENQFGAWEAGDVFEANIALPLAQGLTVNFPFTVTISSSAVGEWYENLPACPCTYEDAKLLVNSICTEGQWVDCGDASQTFHFGATYEVRWTPSVSENAGQQCTYDASGHLITQGIAAGSPDIVSPEGCGYLPEWVINILVDLFCDQSEHCLRDVKPWEEKPCWYYLENWPSNNALSCSKNVVSGIDHMKKLVGDMSCERVTLLIEAASKSATIDGELRRYLLGESTFISNSTQSILTRLRPWYVSNVCRDFPNDQVCLVIEEAIQNLEN